MLHHQDQPLNSAYGGQGGFRDDSSSSLRNRKDGNFNFLPGKGDEAFAGSGGGDENRNQVRSRNLGPLGRDHSSPSPGYHHGGGLLSPRSRLAPWSTLEPLPEIECGDDSYGRVPPDGAEEGRMEEEARRVMTSHSEEKQREKREQQRRKSSLGFGGKEEEEDETGSDDSESDSEFCSRSSGSMSSLNMDTGGDGMPVGGWDRMGVGQPKAGPDESDPTRRGNMESPVKRRSLGNFLEDKRQDGDDQSTDSDGDLSELMDAVWTLRDREEFKAQEMEKHQAQLTMYRRLALIRWVRTLQGRIQEQQNRLQSSFDIILTQRKELLRMGAASAAMANATPPAAVSQS